MSTSGELCIGIDLGTTNSCASIFRNGTVEVISTKSGKKTTPSIVHFKGAERTVGEQAKILMMKSKADMQNTVYGSKRLIGRLMNDPLISKDLKVWPWKVEDHAGKPMIRVPSVSTPIPVEQISAAILSSLRQDAENYTGEKVTKCVITVPAYFNNVQRAATAVAAKIAGLDVLRLVNEPTAAAYSYGLTQFKSNSRGKNIFIFDLGGGTFDVSVLNIDNGKFTVLATKGDSHLGGEDIDNKLLHFFMKELKSEHNITLRPNDELSQNVIRKLRKEVEKFKHSFASQQKVELFIENLAENEDGEPVDFEVDMTRATFDKDICSAFVQKAMDFIEPVLKLANKKTTDIDTVLLVGGSTRLPLIKEELKKLFKPELIVQEVNPDEAVAQGAAILAGSLSKLAIQNPNALQIDDITSLPIGVKLSDGTLNVMIEKSQKLPCKCEDLYTNARDDQETVTLNIYEGEDTQVAVNNQLLGQLVIPFSKKYKAGEAEITCLFAIDQNGILHVDAVDQDTKSKISATIEYKASLKDDEINELIAEEEYLMKTIPEKERMRVSLDRAIKCIDTITESGNITEFDAIDVDPKKIQDLIKHTKDAQMWLKSGFNFYDKKITPAEFESRLVKITKTHPDLYNELLDLYDAA